MSTDRVHDQSKDNRVQRWLAAVLAASALVATSAWTAEREGARRNRATDVYEHAIALRVPYGDGPAAVKLVPEGNDERSRGPASFAVDGDSILLLDSEHERVIAFDRNGVVRRTINDVPGVDIATNGSSIFVLDAATESVTRVSPDGSRSTTGGLPANTLRLKTKDTVGYERDGGFVSLEPSRVSSESASSSTEADGGFDYADVDQHTGTIRDRSTGAVFTIKSTEILGSMNVVGIDAAHNVFVAVEQLLDGGPSLRVAKDIRKFAADGTLRAVIPINIDYAAHPVREFVVTREGAVYHLLPLANVLLVEEWRER